MGTINPATPVVGQPNTTEDPKIISAINTIVNEINGELNNANIAADADIDGSKLDDGTIATAKIASDAVTAAKILDGAVGSAELAALSVLSGKIPFVFQSSTAADTTASGVFGSIASVVPGTYLALAQIYSNGTVYSPSFGSSGGAATVTQPTSLFNVTYPIGAGGGAIGVGTHVAQIVVTATTTVQLSGTYFSGTTRTQLYLFGVTAA